MENKYPLYPVIICGSHETDLWPLARENFPKDFVKIDKTSMFEQTLLRALSIKGVEGLIIACNKDHQFIVTDLLEKNGINPASPDCNVTLLLEPSNRNTATTIALVSILAEEANSNATLIIMPSDIDITNLDAWHGALAHATATASLGWISTMGVVPSKADPDLDYLTMSPVAPDDLAQQGATSVKSFITKPGLIRARDLLEKGNCLWSSGIYISLVTTLLKEFKHYTPKLLKQCNKAIDDAKADVSILSIDQEIMELIPSTTFEKSVLEESSKICVLPLAGNWNKLDSWDDVINSLDNEVEGNQQIGDVLATSCKNSYIHSSSRLIAACGLEDIILIESADSVLALKRGHADDMQKILSTLTQKNRQELSHTTTIFSSWGSTKQLASADNFAVREISINLGASVPLQVHYHRSEQWTIVKGTARITSNGTSSLLHDGMSVGIALGTEHTVKNMGKVPLEIIQVLYGSYLKDDDTIYI